VTARFSFRPCHRLHSGAEFDRVYRQGARAGDHLFAVNALPNAFGHARMGLSISAKTVGNAVARNRVRRLIREIFRHRREQLPPMDLVFTSRPGARNAERAELVASLERLITVAVRKASTDTSRPGNPPAPKEPR
jgi:ribonuclease P protein component